MFGKCPEDENAKTVRRPGDLPTGATMPLRATSLPPVCDMRKTAGDLRVAVARKMTYTALEIYFYLAKVCYQKSILA